MQIQNRGTLAGNICTASPAGDGMPNLLALDAERRAGQPTRPARGADGDFIDGYRHTACRADEIVTAILVPKRSGATRGHFLKLGARKYLVISIVMVGRRHRDRRGRPHRAARVSPSAPARPSPQRLPALEAALVGAAVSDGCGRW